MTKKMTEFVPGRGYSKEDWDAVCDNPEWEEVDLAEAMTFAEAFPELAASLRKPGPARTKEAVSIRLDQDLLAKLRASGPGWQSRVNEALRSWIDKGAA